MPYLYHSHQHAHTHNTTPHHTTQHKNPVFPYPAWILKYTDFHLYKFKAFSSCLTWNALSTFLFLLNSHLYSKAQLRCFLPVWFYQISIKKVNTFFSPSTFPLIIIIAHILLENIHLVIRLYSQLSWELIKDMDDVLSVFETLQNLSRESNTYFLPTVWTKKGRKSVTKVCIFSSLLFTSPTFCSLFCGVKLSEGEKTREQT